MRLVILGPGSFLGRALSRKASQLGLEVLPLGRSVLDLTATGAGNNLAALLRPSDVLVFLSAITPDKGNGLDAFNQNFFMGQAVADAIARQSVNQVVYISSDAVYPFDRGLVSESSPTRADSLYAAAHLAREALMQASAPDRTSILRCTQVYGPGDSHHSYGISSFCRSAQKSGEIHLFGRGEEFRDHVFIEDVVEAILTAAMEKITGLFNVVSGRSIRHIDAADLIGKTLDQAVETVFKERKQPITHRHYCADHLRSSLLRRPATPLVGGIRAMLEQDDS